MLVYVDSAACFGSNMHKLSFDTLFKVVLRIGHIPNPHYSLSFLQIITIVSSNCAIVEGPVKEERHT